MNKLFFASSISKKFDAFISYSSEDYCSAEKLASLLHDAGLEIWFRKRPDHIDYPSFSETSKALLASNVLLVLIGQEGIRPWSRGQIEDIPVARLEKYFFYMIPVLLPGSNPAVLPLFLRTIHYCDLRKWDNDELSSLIKRIRPNPKVFLCHAHEDRHRIESLYNSLKQNGFDPWFDKEQLTVGDLWKDKILQAIEEADFFAICLSQVAVTKNGFINREIRTAISEYKHRHFVRTYLLPIRLDDCEIPRIWLDDATLLRDLQWIDVFEDNKEAESHLAESIWLQWRKMNLR